MKRMIDRHLVADKLFKDILITVLILLITFVISLVFFIFDRNSYSIPMLLVVAVFIISYLTNGAFCGTAGAVIGVALICFAFSEPYFHLKLEFSGAAVTAVAMLAVSIVAGAMAKQIKIQEQIRIETEREKLRGNLLRAVSHDLRTPLTSISGSVSAIIENIDKIPKEQQIKLLKETGEEAEWLIRMVENLLSVTCINSDGATVKKAPELVEEIVEGAVRKTAKHFQNAEIAVDLPSEPLLVPMDATLIQQVIVNLLENAITHGGKNDGITLKAVAGDDTVTVSVADSGKGIPAEMLEHIFDGTAAKPADRADSSRHMGIGLSVCMSIVKAHGGMMYAKNCANGGAEFGFTLPIKEEEKECC
ncbi:MAG: ATP-binding protein [Acutalibacteraceae bacterium]